MENFIEQQPRLESFFTVNPKPPTEERMTELLDARKDKPLEISHEQLTISLDSETPVGEGGTKQVFKGSIGQESVALAVPKQGIDSAEVLLKKWEAVTEEPNNTRVIRELGIPTNPLSEIVHVKVNGVTFPSLIMTPYEELPFVVRDKKNPHQGERQELLTNFNDDFLEETLAPMAEEVSRLIENNITPASDSLNICIQEGKIHLFMNDLGKLSLEEIEESRKLHHIERYSMLLEDAIINTLTENEFAQYESSESSFKEILLKLIKDKVKGQ